MKLFEIDEQIRDCVDWDTGEILDIDRLNQLQLERTNKISGVALWIKELAYEAGAMDQEIKNLQARKKSAENKVESLKKWLAIACEGKKWEDEKSKVSFRNTTAVEIDDEDKIDKKYKVEKLSYTISKTAIREAIEAGETVAGAHIQSNISCTVK